MKFRPCIDLHNGKVKQIVGGSLTDSASALRTNFESEYGSDYYAKLYQRDNLTGGHVIQLGKGNDVAAKLALQSYPMGLQVGGGITPQNAAEYLDCGASCVIVTSYLVEDGDLSMRRLNAMSRAVPRERLVIDLSCRKLRNDNAYFVVFNRWQNFTTTKITQETLNQLSDHCCEFLIHAVDVEGKVSGIDETLVALLAEISPIPCVYAGGISSMEDIATIERLGQGKIDFTVGSALDIFGGKLSYQEIVTRYGNSQDNASC